MQLPLIINPDNAFTFLKTYGRSVDLKVNDIVRAEVLNVLDSGDVALRIQQNNGENSIIFAKSDIALAKGSTVFFKVAASDAEIKLQFMGTASDGNKMVEDSAGAMMRQNVLKMLSEFSDARIRPEDLTLVDEFVKALPAKLKAAFPQFIALNRNIPEVGRLGPELLRQAIEDSGVLFETKLKIALKNGTSGKIDNILNSDDYKLQLLKVKSALKEKNVVDALRMSAIKVSEMEIVVDRLIRHIEFFQVTSGLYDSIYAFLPLTWKELKEGELSFKKGAEDRGESYTCEINLELEGAGRMSVSITEFEGNFFVTFYLQEGMMKELIEQEGQALRKRFKEVGLPLKVLNVIHKPEIVFGASKTSGLTLRV